MGADEEPNRLRALLTLMREFGATKVALPDGLVLERPPLSPLEAATAHAVRQTEAKGAASKDDDVDEDLDGDEAKEKELELEWNAHWRRVTLSSGGNVPRFPGADKAQRFLRSL